MQFYHTIIRNREEANFELHRLAVQVNFYTEFLTCYFSRAFGKTIGQKRNFSRIWILFGVCFKKDDF